MQTCKPENLYSIYILSHLNMFNLLTLHLHLQTFPLLPPRYANSQFSGKYQATTGVEFYLKVCALVVSVYSVI